MGMAVQNGVEIGAEHAFQPVGIAQILLVLTGAAHGIVMQGADAHPAHVAIVFQFAGEPADLRLAEIAIAVFPAVAFLDGRIQPGHHQPQFGDFEQGPGRFGREGDAGAVAVQAFEEELPVAPFVPIGFDRLLVIGFAAFEIAGAGVPIDIVVAGNGDNPPSRQFQGVGKAGDEIQRLPEFRPPALFHQAAGQQHQIGFQPFAALQESQIVGQPPQQRCEAAVFQ
jgi:hypothetical protein